MRLRFLDGSPLLGVSGLFGFFSLGKADPVSETQREFPDKVEPGFNQPERSAPVLVVDNDGNDLA